MLKRLTTYILLVLMVTGCYKFKAPEKPKDLISKDKMVKVLIDVYLLKTASLKYANTMSKFNIDPQEYVYDKYGVDSLQFASSNSYYTYYVDDYEEIYTKVKDSLERLKSFYEELEVTERKEKEEKDSLNRQKLRDSLRPSRLRDSLQKTSQNQTDLKEELENGLIEPVSDKDFQ